MRIRNWSCMLALSGMISWAGHARAAKEDAAPPPDAGKTALPALSRSESNDEMTTQALQTLVKSYVASRPQLDETDQAPPARGIILQQGAKIVPWLIDALNQPSPAYQKKRTDIIYLLGEIGSPQAFKPLLAAYCKEPTKAARRRIGLSAGASLDREQADEFINVIEKQNDPEGWALLREITGQDFAKDAGTWRKYLKQEGNLEAVIARCRQKSKPILG